VQHVDPTETRAHDKGVQVADLIADDSIHRACSFDRRCGAVHFLDTMVGGSTRTAGVPMWNTSRRRLYRD
jgi:hypothetical protein